MTARALILDGKRILFFHRFKDGKEYFVLPGGNIEEGETEEECVVREVKEETTLDISIDSVFFKYHNDFDDKDHVIFLVKKFSGKAVLSGPEKGYDSENNRYILEWHSIDEIKELNIVPGSLKEKMIEELR